MTKRDRILARVFVSMALLLFFAVGALLHSESSLFSEAGWWMAFFGVLVACNVGVCRDVPIARVLTVILYVPVLLFSGCVAGMGVELELRFGLEDSALVTEGGAIWKTPIFVGVFAVFLILWIWLFKLTIRLGRRNQGSGSTGL